MIADGYEIDANDLVTVLSTPLNTIQSDNAALPTVVWLNLSFANLVASTDSTWRTRRIPLPDDYYLAELAVTTGEHTGTVTVTADSGVMIEPAVCTGTVAAPGVSKLARYYGYDPFVVKSNTNPVQLLLRGSVLEITAETTATASPSQIAVAVGLMHTRRRR